MKHKIATFWRGTNGTIIEPKPIYPFDIFGDNSAVAFLQLDQLVMFGPNCSNFTFDRVKRFGILDATVIFQVNDKGFINAKFRLLKKRADFEL